MASAFEVRKIICNYLSGGISLHEFAEMFESHYSDIIIARKQEDVILADRIQAMLGRVSSEYSSEAELREWLLPLSVEPVNTLIGVPSFREPLNQYFGFGASRASSSSDTSPAVVFGSTVVLQQ